MARLIRPRRALSTNPLKSSAPLGAAMAYLGIEGAVPLLHGAQGCTAFAMVHMVRHFREAIPLQTTAMNEVSTILGGADQIEEAIANLKKKAAPKFIGIASTALTETSGDDIAGDLQDIRARRPDFDDVRLVYASTPDFEGALEDGWAKAVTAIVDALVPQAEPCRREVEQHQVNILPAAYLTPAEVEEIARLVRAFGLTPIMLPDLSTSLDGHLAEDWSGRSLGGTPLDIIPTMARSKATFAIGESMAEAATLLGDRGHMPVRVFPALTGLTAVDAFVSALMGLAGVTDAPAAIKRERARLQDAMLDAHFHTGGLRYAIAAEPDLAYALSTALESMGAEAVCCVTTSAANPIIDLIPADEATVGDLGDLEAGARAGGATLLIAHAHGRHVAAALGLPLLRAGFPINDRLGAQDACRVGYRGTRAFLFEVANAVLAQSHQPRPEAFGAAPISPEFEHDGPQIVPH
ncbi:nitrogenase molybdenum-iron protein NifN [Rhodothalassium salexigens DSM 2132]|uniref:Nitrogenase iron-molybdenum cofactor biosynthesis protein NifN n=1 Tax=Rhodothalassium salexigens DSM 2132 TaxID=1188247 RepID=A0A4R2PKI8_RHOSA|nr:nitrogenase iron-molybdenum cofactor biosynthesis protein NifN [Rhodothalassium salexigens]MBB4211553.1 nitrogenase molybdenum-iron protein NifN [Rhodothalassium salexigens DSM 2132]MBK1639791.1 nitrogenase iron-molybdenum cofactor biosynthesis protein NifN [Rhodothalassium salexigens DSM 2132]TCP34515.1 nitrogenase molybdenum-iron protein NifN [Rhodothalassium salexigens DSM 2132]